MVVWDLKPQLYSIIQSVCIHYVISVFEHRYYLKQRFQCFLLKHLFQIQPQQLHLLHTDWQVCQNLLLGDLMKTFCKAIRLQNQDSSSKFVPRKDRYCFL